MPTRPEAADPQCELLRVRTALVCHVAVVYVQRGDSLDGGGQVRSRGSDPPGEVARTLPRSSGQTERRQPAAKARVVSCGRVQGRGLAQ